ncbi:MAG: serine protease [Pleurocapsa sp. MO_226.B13]|nr:serine protease [Pleurocapsa sp. MO_226.B13]
MNKYVSDLCLNSQTKIKSSDLLAQFPLKKAEAIVVRIRAKMGFGSGILLQRDRNTYRVVTNRHVVDRGNRYYIQTSDDRVHVGTLVTVSPQDDLAILEFTSDRPYSIARINTAPIQPHEPLFAAGFPFNSDRLQITAGKLLLQMSKPLQQGYQLGYSNTIDRGMSGGAIFNSLGEVVGVNGKSANPVIADYQYQDSTYPSQQLKQQMIQLSWGIPITKAIELSE